MRPPIQHPHQSMRPAGGDGFEVGLVAILGTLCLLAGVVYTGAWIAAALVGGHVSGGLTELIGVVGRLATNPGDPEAAWGPLATNLPSPVPYWASTIAVFAGVAVTVAVIVKLWRGQLRGASVRLGVEPDARMAKRGDISPLAISSPVPPTGRMLLGRLAPRGPMLATEDRERHPRRGRRAEARQGDRGSVALIGPTRSGKTVLASAGIIAWDGPVIALSVKRDLYDATAAARAKRGDIAVFDPSGVTGLQTARWTPLRAITTTSAAARAGRALAQAIPTNGVNDGDFWRKHGETLTTAYMSLAALSTLLPGKDDSPRLPLTMARLASWAFLHVGITDPTVHELITLGLADDRPLEVRLLAKDTMTKLMAFEGEDPKIRASIYATARLAFDAWNEPAIAHSASLDPRAHYFSEEIWDHNPVYVDLNWVMGGEPGKPRTLYMSAPSTEFERLAPVFGGMLGDLREQLHAWDIAGRKLDKPLLILIDEAGQLELRWFPEEVSTIAGLGAFFVTGWQSKAQITARYGALADAVLSGHRSKVIFNGTDDPATLEYATRIAGTVHINQQGTSTDGNRRTVSQHPQREDLLPAHVIRQMRRTDAVLFHGTLPPVHLRLVQWWRTKELRALVPHGDDGKSLPPPKDGTCPVAEPRSSDVEPVIDKALVAEQLANLPRPRGAHRDIALAAASSSNPSSARPGSSPAGQGTLDFSSDDSTSRNPAPNARSAIRNRVAGRCAVCSTWVPVGEGTNQPYGSRTVVVCDPSCDEPTENDGTPGEAGSHQTGVVGFKTTAPASGAGSDSTSSAS